jgi:hypothetical protein
MPETYGNFRSEVWESLENDPRFEISLDKACNRGIDETLAESNYGNFEFTTPSVATQEVYQLPEEMIYVNHVTYDNIPLMRMTLEELLERKAILRTSLVYYHWPLNFLVKENQDLLLSPPSSDSGRTITVYGTVKYPDLKGVPDPVTGLDDLLNPMPLRRLYTNAAYHYARYFLLQQDGQDERAAQEYKLFEHEIGKSNRRLRGNAKDKVRRIV